MSATRFNVERRLNGDARAIGAVYTEEDYELTFDVWSNGNQCAAGDIVPVNGRRIWGVLYEVPDYLIKRETSGGRKSLDGIEGKRYKRVSISLRYPDGSPLNKDTITYVVRDSYREANIRTSLNYCSHIISGLRDHSDTIPGEYIDYVKERIIANNPDLCESVKAL